MKLLIVTQAVDLDDPILGFFHRWIEEFAKHCEEVTVICLRKGRFELPHNVSVYSLGKEEGKGRVIRLLRFFRYIISLSNRYSSVFVHMNPEYVCLAGWLWRLTGKRVVLWYVHRSVDLKLRIANLFATAIATASPESLRLNTHKKHVLGHGIDVEAYPAPQPSSNRISSPRILAAGRISSAKNQLLIIKAFSLLSGALAGRLTIAGAPATERDVAYEHLLKREINSIGIAERVTFLGGVVPERMHEVYGAQDLLLHASDTGSLDKVVLEALASGLRVVSTSDAFAGGSLPVTVAQKDPHAIADAVRRSLGVSWDAAAARTAVSSQHDLGKLIEKLQQLLLQRHP